MRVLYMLLIYLSFEQLNKYLYEKQSKIYLIVKAEAYKTVF
jgi:hypothetical protein